MKFHTRCKNLYIFVSTILFNLSIIDSKSKKSSKAISKASNLHPITVLTRDQITINTIKAPLGSVAPSKVIIKERKKIHSDSRYSYSENEDSSTQVPTENKSSQQYPLSNEYYDEATNDDNQISIQPTQTGSPRQVTYTEMDDYTYDDVTSDDNQISIQPTQTGKPRQVTYDDVTNDDNQISNQPTQTGNPTQVTYDDVANDDNQISNQPTQTGNPTQVTYYDVANDDNQISNQPTQTGNPTQVTYYDVANDDNQINQPTQTGNPTQVTSNEINPAISQPTSTLYPTTIVTNQAVTVGQTSENTRTENSSNSTRNEVPSSFLTTGPSVKAFVGVYLSIVVFIIISGITAVYFYSEKAQEPDTSFYVQFSPNIT